METTKIPTPYDPIVVGQQGKRRRVMLFGGNGTLLCIRGTRKRTVILKSGLWTVRSLGGLRVGLTIRMWNLHLKSSVIRLYWFALIKIIVPIKRREIVVRHSYNWDKY